MMRGSHREISVLFVCLGNICRSPMAEGAFRKAASDAGLHAEVDSAGTASYHIGEPPDPRAVQVAQRYGIDIANMRGRQLNEKDFDSFTHIIALDTANLAGIRARAPRHTKAKIGLLLDALEGREGESVPDPYYGDDDGFEECWQVIVEAIDVFVAKLAADPIRA